MQVGLPTQISAGSAPNKVMRSTALGSVPFREVLQGTTADANPPSDRADTTTPAADPGTDPTVAARSAGGSGRVRVRAVKSGSPRDASAPFFLASNSSLPAQLLPAALAWSRSSWSDNTGFGDGTGELSAQTPPSLQAAAPSLTSFGNASLARAFATAQPSSKGVSQVTSESSTALVPAWSDTLTPASSGAIVPVTAEANAEVTDSTATEVSLPVDGADLAETVSLSLPPQEASTHILPVESSSSSLDQAPSRHRVEPAFPQDSFHVPASMGTDLATPQVLRPALAPATAESTAPAMRSPKAGALLSVKPTSGSEIPSPAARAHADPPTASLESTERISAPQDPEFPWVVPQVNSATSVVAQQVMLSQQLWTAGWTSIQTPAPFQPLSGASSGSATALKPSGLATSHPFPGAVEATEATGDSNNADGPADMNPTHVGRSLAAGAPGSSDRASSKGEAQLPETATAFLTTSPGLGGHPPASGAQPGTVHASVAPASLPSAEPANPPAIAQGRLLHAMDGSQMKVDLSSAEFGRVTVHAGYARSGISAQITMDDPQLSAAVSAHLPGVEQTLAEAHGIRSSLQISTGLADTHAQDQQPGSESQRERPFAPVRPSRQAGPADNPPEDLTAPSLANAGKPSAFLAYPGQLNIRI